MSVDCVVIVGSVVPEPLAVVVLVVPAAVVLVELGVPEPVDDDGGVVPDAGEVDDPAAAALADAVPEAPPDCGGIGPSVQAMSAVIRLTIDRVRSLPLVWVRAVSICFKLRLSETYRAPSRIMAITLASSTSRSVNPARRFVRAGSVSDG
jgi:hypothetical protein